MKQWYIIETEKEYEAATRRYEDVREASRDSAMHKEKMLLALLISQYEEKHWRVPGLDPIEMILIRMEDFGYKPADLAREYGDKGTVSKVLNYKQPLSLNMIRIFSRMLRIPADALLREYKLQG